MPHCMNRMDFVKEAEALVSACSKLSSKDAGSLLDWYVVGEQDMGSHSPPQLLHPPILRENGSLHGTSTSLRVSDEDPFIDSVYEGLRKESDTNELDLDREAASVVEATTTAASTTFEWIFSILYSDTWKVPILYFRVQHLDGRPLWRETVLQLLRCGHDGDGEEGSSWDFVSQEEHPVTGEPSFFLHPCQSSARLELLLKSNTDESLKHENRHEADNKYTSLTPGCVLLSWMSLVLPAVQVPFSSDLFSSLMQILQETNRRGN